ncbi:MAG: hypothetical protein J5879_05750 [Clostridia bacterium]|nr:hypothetical protein [Clostridia bacterium]
MKNTARILCAVMILSLIAAVLAISPAALSSNDWEVVNHPSGTPANPVVMTNANKGIILTQEGHYPSSNAGLLYTQPLNINDGITMNVTVMTDSSDSSDAWYGIFLMNRPVYFNVNNRNPEEGVGIVLLCRTTEFQWFTVSENGFNKICGASYDDDKEYYQEGVTLDFEIKMVDGELHILVDGIDTDQDFSEYLLPYLTDNQAYIGFSMSDTDLIPQTFVINYLNGQQPASEGDALPMQSGETQTQPETTADPTAIDFDNVSSFTLIDFTDPDVLGTIKTINNCKLSYDEDEKALKVEVTGDDPFFNIPIKKKMYFDGDKFCILKMEYKTDYEGSGQFYYTTKEVPNWEYCMLSYDFSATNGEFAVYEQDMQESANWTGEIRNFRIDPLAEEGQAGTVFYYKTINFEEYVEPETQAPQTTAPQTTEPQATEPDATEPAGSEDVATAPATTDNGGSGKTTSSGFKKALPFICIGAGLVVVAVVVVVIILSKKKK